MYFWTDKTIPAPAPELLLANILRDKVEVGSLLAVIAKHTPQSLSAGTLVLEW